MRSPPTLFIVSIQHAVQESPLGEAGGAWYFFQKLILLRFVNQETGLKNVFSGILLKKPFEKVTFFQKSSTS